MLNIPSTLMDGVVDHKFLLKSSRYDLARSSAVRAVRLLLAGTLAGEQS